MRIENYQFKNWQETERGVLLDENEDWILIKSIPVDFLVDGYKLLKKEHIENREENLDFSLNKVLELKKLNFEKPKGFKFMEAIGFLEWAQDEYGCFEFQDEVEDELFYGIIKKSNKKSFYIDSIKSDGTIDVNFDAEFFLDELRVISFESDYFNSIRLLYNFRKKN